MVQDNALSEELKQFRFRLKVSQLGFAIAANVTQSAISAFETHGIASANVIEKIRTTMQTWE